MAADDAPLMEEPMQQDIPGLVPYPETADRETSSDAYALRFAGSAGAWMLRVQERIALRFAADYPGSSVLDVGGGHGQLALPLARCGHRVTVLGSHPDCAHRLQEALREETIRFLTANVIDLPFPDHSFDLVVCFRLLTHCRRWNELVDELCRVARRAVVFDYPTGQSLNAVAPALFGWKRRVEKDTRTWTLFRHDEITRVFARRGFVARGRRKQFFLPMVLHRMIGRAPVSAGLEACCRAVGLTALWGSPVIVRMVRHDADREESSAGVGEPS